MNNAVDTFLDLQAILSDDANQVLNKIDLSFLEGKEITITGATGLIGINLISTFLEFNKNLKSKIKINAIYHSEPKNYVRYLFDDPQIKSFKGDVTDKEFIKSISLSDYLIHSAGYAQPGRFMSDKLKTFQINSSSTEYLFERVHPGGGFLFISSAEIYSGSLANSSEEDSGVSTPSHQRACYIEGKRAGETIVNIYRDEGFKAVSARLALAYGPGVGKDDSRVLYQLIQKGIEGEISLMDDGSALRTYCYITDVTTMLLNLLRRSDSEVYNVGGKSIVSIRDLADLISKKMQVNFKKPIKNEYLTDAPKHVGLILEKIEKEFNLKSYTPIDDGIERTIRWCRKINDLPGE